MLGFPKNNDPVKGKFAKQMIFQLLAKIHYDKGIANDEELKFINDLKKQDEENKKRLETYDIKVHWDKDCFL